MVAERKIMIDEYSEWYLHSALYKEILYTRDRVYPCKNAYAKYDTTAVFRMDLCRMKPSNHPYIYTCPFLHFFYLNLFIKIYRFVDQNSFERY